MKYSIAFLLLLCTSFAVVLALLVSSRSGVFVAFLPGSFCATELALSRAGGLPRKAGICLLSAAAGAASSGLLSAAVEMARRTDEGRAIEWTHYDACGLTAITMFGGASGCIYAAIRLTSRFFGNDLVR